MADKKKVTDADKAEQPGKSEAARKIVRFFQWIAALGCLAMAAACFSREIHGTLGGAMLLIAGWLVSPMVDELDLLEKLTPKARLIVQIAGAAVLFAGGWYISSLSADNAPDTPSAETQAVTAVVCRFSGENAAE